MHQLDKLDRKILFELDKDSRQSFSQLAKRLRQGRDRVTYRVERLQERGILQRYTTSVNLAKLGFTIFKTYLQLENNKARTTEFKKYLTKHPRVYWIAESDGAWDLMVAVFARTPKEFHTIHIEMLSQFHDIVLGFTTYTLVDIWKYQKDYLVGKGGELVTIGGEPAEYPIDATDCALLKILCDDSRMPATEIATKMKTTPTVVRYRMEKLEEAGVITGYPIDIDLNTLNMLFFKAQLFLRDYRESLRMEFLDYCTTSPHITYCIRPLGDCMVEIEIEALDYAQYNQIIDEIRGKFSKLIRNVQSVLIRKTSFNWVPRDLEKAISTASKSNK